MSADTHYVAIDSAANCRVDVTWETIVDTVSEEEPHHLVSEHVHGVIVSSQPRGHHPTVQQSLNVLDKHG